MCTANKKRGEEARGFTTVRGAPQNGDVRVEADFAIMRLTAQPRHKICIFFSKVAPKIVRKRGKCKYQEICLQESSFLHASVVRHFLQWSPQQRLKPICESAVVDLVDLVMSSRGSPKRQRGLALPCHQRKKKKLKATKGPVQSAFEPTTIRGSKVSGLYRHGYNYRNRRLRGEKKNPWNHCHIVTARECSILGQEKVCVVLLTKLD